MSEQFSQIASVPASNLFHFPIRGVPSEGRQLPNQEIPTPKSDKIFEQVNKLKKVSEYPSQFDYETYKKLELRFGLKQPRGGITFNTPFKLANNHHTSRQSPYSFEIDIYNDLLPIDISDVWETLYTVFETDKYSKWRLILESRIPLRIGSASDSFMLIEQRYGVTKELLKILNFYKYPYSISTRSDLIAQDEYMKLLNPQLCSIQTSISSTNDEMNTIIEKGVPSAKRRLLALQKLGKNGFWTAVKVSPFFPIYADGYFTDPNFDRKNMPEPFYYSSFEMVDEISSYRIPSVLAEIPSFSSITLAQIEKAFGRDLHSFFRRSTNSKIIASNKTQTNSHRFKYNQEEINAYLEQLNNQCLKHSIVFSKLS